MKAVMKYPGAKWSMAHWIISKFPEHRSYLEPFFGSGAVLFSKPRSDIEEDRYAVCVRCGKILYEDHVNY